VSPTSIFNNSSKKTIFEAVSIALLSILIFLSSSGFTAPNKITFTLRFILTFTIDFETAKRYREANKMPHQFRRAAWTDLTVEVYL